MSSCEQRQTFTLPGFKPMRNILLSSAVQRGADSDARGQINYPEQPFPLLLSDRGEKSGPPGVERACLQPKQPLCTVLPEHYFHLYLFLPGWCCFNPPFQLFPLALSPIFPIFTATSHLQQQQNGLLLFTNITGDPTAMQGNKAKKGGGQIGAGT